MIRADGNESCGDKGIDEVERGAQIIDQDAGERLGNTVFGAVDPPVTPPLLDLLGCQPLKMCTDDDTPPVTAS